ncbi:MAG: efflux RND transporter periplasmic adaptor subunit [Candidatus Latescibacteria bacterium]|nr:efflux RND transporter periplasmic adaptor subunit [Candidatus Latescibacterota bacterium]
MDKVKKKRKKGRWKKIVAGLVIVIVIAILIGKNFTGNGKKKEIKTVKVKIGDVVNKLTETGNIELLRTVEVKSKIAGTIEDILVKEGEEVKEGQELCIIDPDPTQTLLLFQKRSAVDRTRINNEQAKKELERKRELAKTALISTKDVEDAENSYLISQNAYSLAKQELEIMEREIETTGAGSDERIVSSKVRAPYNGYITQRYVEEGDVVTSGMSSVIAGTNLFQIGDPSTKIIKANISEVDIGVVFIGAEVNIMLDAYPDTSFAGVIRHISPVGALVQGRNVVTFKTEVEIIDKDQRLRPGMSCDVDVIISEADSVRYLPIESVYEKKEGSKEEENETVTLIVYVKHKKEENPSKKKEKKLAFFRKKTDPLDDFTEREVEVGIRSENRFQIITEMDTTTAVTLDAEKLFKDLEKRKKAKEEKEDKKEDEKSVEVTM